MWVSFLRCVMKISRFPVFIALIAASLASHGRSPAEMDALYRQAGLQAPQISLINNILMPIGKDLHVNAKFESNLTFKSLKIGAEFPIKSEKSASGFSVTNWHFADEPSADIEVKAGSEDAFECWSQNTAITVTCYLVEGEKLAMAFGQKLKTTGIILTRPAAGFDPVSDPAYMGVAPMLVGIFLGGAGEDLAKAAVSYFSDMYGKRPSISTDDEQAGIGPSNDECERVNAKKLSGLTTNDLRLRKECAAPINDLLSLSKSEKTIYAFNSSKGQTEIVVHRFSYGNVYVALKLLHPKLQDASKRALDKTNAAVNEYRKRVAAEKQKDF